MEVALPREEESGSSGGAAAKKPKNSDEEMDIGKIEDEEDDGYQPSTVQLPWDMEDEEIFDSRSGEILEQELVQMARKEELDFMEKFGVYEDATIEECFAETGRAAVGMERVDVNKGTAENPNIRSRLVAMDSNRKERRIGLTFSHLCRPWRPRRFSSASQRLTKRSFARTDGSDRSSCSSTSRRLI